MRKENYKTRFLTQNTLDKCRNSEMSQPKSSQLPHKILVVDDVEANLHVVARRLEGGNFEIHTADSGEAALQFISDSKPDLVLLDYMMPKMSGIDVLNVIRGEWELESLPVIMLTARAEAEAVIEALEAGADDYVSKPIDFDVLKARIETQLQKLNSSEDLRMANAALGEKAAMRVLAFDQMREELELEIQKRKQAEEKLASMNAADGQTNADGDWFDRLEDAIGIVDHITECANSGRSINAAQLAALKSKLSTLRKEVAGSSDG